MFTPASFAALFAEMSRQGLIDFACTDFYDTQVNEIEFIVNMGVCDNAFERTQSWQNMTHLVEHNISASAPVAVAEHTEEMVLS